MSFVSTATVYSAGLGLHIAGALAALIWGAKPAWARRVSLAFALLGALVEGVAAVMALAGGVAAWTLPSGVPMVSYAFALDAISAYFALAFSLLAVAVTIYSFGYLKEYEGQKSLAVFGFFFNVLLLSLAASLAAANTIFFLIAWEVMALAAYFLVSFEHEDEEARRAGILYLIMSHLDTACLLGGFGILMAASGSGDFTSFHAIGSRLPDSARTAALLLFLAGFGIKAGIIPLHIWLPAAHPVAPSNVSALMSGIVIKTGIYGLVRVSLDFFDAVPLWMGILLMLAAVVSAVLGVLYALMEHDLKRLLAYHSIENIGIILLGLGAALTFRTLHHPALAAMALAASLYHTLNHAAFKGLLFLGAGAVAQRAHTRNIEELGGLARRMPWTSALFLIGAVAISGLPPLNGFVSEWLTYQSLLAGFRSTEELTRLIFPIAGSLLALTGALAAACFVKAFGITFLALPRGEGAERAREANGSMIAGMGTLAAACVALGLGATWFLPVFDGVTRQLLGVPISGSLVAGGGLILTAGSPRAGSVSTPALAAAMVLMSLLPAAFWLVWSRHGKRRTGPVWDCGLPGLTAENEYTATAFSKPLRMIFSALYKPRREIQSVFDVSPYYPKAVRFESEIQPTFEKRFYQPLWEAILTVAGKMRAIQAGSIHAYLAYIFVTLLALLLFGVRP